jgi:transcriptional regulator with XRE-family HTH domain
MIIKVGERITELRNKYNLTQHALAKELGVSRSSVNAWEMGISHPSIEKIIETH